MKLEELANTIEKMIIEHDYPGFEPRSLVLGLPEPAVKSSARVFGQALKHENIFVRLAALRWFKERPGMAKNHLKDVVELLHDQDEWVRCEAIKTIECSHVSEQEIIVKISSLLKDPNQMVRQESAKACGKLLVKSPNKNVEVVGLLREAAQDVDEKVRWKAQKALRRIGAYSVSA